MIDKKWSMALLLATIAVAGAFASGDMDEDNDVANGAQGGRGGGEGRPGMMDGDDSDRQAGMEERYAELLEEAETYTGTFTVIDGEYPALVDADGEIWYLDARGFVTEENIPEEGAEIEVQAVTSNKAPNVLMVLEAAIDGEELERQKPERGGMTGNRGGGAGMQGPPRK